MFYQTNEFKELQKQEAIGRLRQMGVNESVETSLENDELTISTMDGRLTSLDCLSEEIRAFLDGQIEDRKDHGEYVYHIVEGTQGDFADPNKDNKGYFLMTVSTDYGNWEHDNERLANEGYVKMYSAIPNGINCPEYSMKVRTLSGLLQCGDCYSDIKGMTYPVTPEQMENTAKRAAKAEQLEKRCETLDR